MSCAGEEGEKQKLYGGFPNNMVGGRRKRSVEMIGTDTQYCAVQANCDINMITHMVVAMNCGQRLNIEPQFDNQILQVCQCIQRALGKSQDEYPCEPKMG